MIGSIRITRRHLVALTSIVATLAAADPQRPLPTNSPPPIAAPGVRVNVHASDELDVDRLRSFARPLVTLWLSTKSNLLRESTIEVLNRFDASFVQLRAPLTESQARALEKAPLAGVWLEASALGLRALGPRPLAVQLQGPLDEAIAARIRAARPAQLEWEPPPALDALTWGLFRSLPGRKWVTSASPGSPCEAHIEREPASRAHVAVLLALGAAAFPCGANPRVIIEPDTDRWLLQSLIVRDPTLELELDVGADEARAKKVSALLEELGLGSSR